MTQQLILLLTEEEAERLNTQIHEHFGNLRLNLMEMEDRKGWRALGYKSMRNYMMGEFSKDVSQLYRELQAGKLERELLPMGNKIGVLPERHMREMVSLKTPIEVQSAHVLAMGIAQRTGQPLSHLHYRAAVQTVIELKNSGKFAAIEETQIHIEAAPEAPVLMATATYLETEKRRQQHVIDAMNNKGERVLTLEGTMQQCLTSLSEYLIKNESKQQVVVKAIFYEVKNHEH